MSEEMARLGFVVAPVLDLSDSPAYDLGNLRLLEWLIHMLETGKIRSIFLSPPCTTFSPAAHPAARSYTCPKGWNRHLPKVLLGNVMAFRSLVLLRVSRRYRRPAGLEQPRRSKMAWLDEWRSLLELGFEEAVVVVASCACGSPHQKEFRLLVYMLDAASMTVHCTRGHKRVKVQGKYTKPSAAYVPGVAQRFALAFARALRRSKPEEIQQGDGLESVVVNDLLLAKHWEVERSWRWKKHSHINVLEIGSVVSLLKEAAISTPCSRFPVLVDSQVAKGALAKGRSSARTLKPVINRASALQVSGGLYPAYGFAPTRYNAADHPTRDRPMPPPCSQSIVSILHEDEIALLQNVGLSRGHAGWTRLVVLLICLSSSKAASTPCP